MRFESVFQRTVSNHLPSIDLIRGLASLWVVIFHINEPIPYHPNWWTDFCKLGWLGVPAFFVISGFCMGMLEQRSSPRLFLLSRLARIYPPYLASLGVVLVAALFLRLVFGVNDAVVLPRNFHDGIATIFLLLDPVTGVQSINWVYWSLVVEVAFYFHFALCLNFKRHRTLVLLMPLFLYPWCDVDILGIRPIVWIEHYPVFLVGYFLYRTLARADWIVVIALAAMIAACFATRTMAESIIVGLQELVWVILPDFTAAAACK